MLSHSNNEQGDAKTISIQVKVGCYGMSSIDVTYTPDAKYEFVYEDINYPTSLFTVQLQDGFPFKYLFLSQDLFSVTTDQADCSWHEVVWVTDSGGLTDSVDTPGISWTPAPGA